MSFWVPDFSFNLTSARKLTKDLNRCLVFSRNHCYIQDLWNWKTIGVGELRTGLSYLLQKSNFIPPLQASNLGPLMFGIQDLDILRIPVLSCLTNIL